MAKGSKTLYWTRDKVLELRDAGRAVWNKHFAAGVDERSDGLGVIGRRTAGAAPPQQNSNPKPQPSKGQILKSQTPKDQTPKPKTPKPKPLKGQTSKPQDPKHQAPYDLADLLDRQTLPRDHDELSEQMTDAARAAAPLVWLLGKVQSGKSSIVQGLTGCSDAAIGEGFRACTNSARIFDFPDAAPMIRFLDTRGLGEAAYDPADDIAFCAPQTQLLLVVVKAMDPQQGAIVDLVHHLRGEHPHWPVLVAQTCLHDAYEPGQGHLLPYPYGTHIKCDKGDPPADRANNRNRELDRALHYQRQLFAAMPGNGAICFVPLDFTLPEDGLEPRLYGLTALIDAIGEAAPTALARMLQEALSVRRNHFSAAAHPHILGYAGAAAAVDLLPIAGLVAVPAVQAKLLHMLAGIYGAQWDKRLWLEFSAQLGAGIAMRLLAGLGLRELAKLIPGYGQTIGTAGAAATSFITTYALGRAACVFLAAKQVGVDDAQAVAKAYREGLAQALDLVKDRSFTASPSPSSSPPSPSSPSSPSVASLSVASPSSSSFAASEPPPESQKDGMNK